MKKVLIATLCMGILLSSLTACGNGKDSGDDPVNAQTTINGENNTGDTGDTEEPLNNTVDFSEHIEFTYWMSASTNEIESDYNKNSIVQYLNNKFNMTLKFQQPVSGTEADSINLMLGTGEYTDIIDSSWYTGSLDQLLKDGIIIDIAQYLDYMPNLSALLDADEVLRKNTYNDNGQILKLPNYITEDPLHWGGLVYRRDILETMTGGSVQFPSGNDEPVTIEDWDYMLPLFQQYFEAANLPDFAALIIPASGYFVTSDLITTFGAASSYHIVDGTVKYGPIEDGFYQYLDKMHQWFDKGYVYKDFATRVNDMFFMPNPALTYGGASGIWFGMTGQLGEVLSQPDYGLYVNVEPLANPIDATGGIVSAPNMMYRGKSDQTGGAMIASTCSNIERLLTVMDYLYSEEASYLKEYGITKEQGAADYELYREYGLENGSYTLDEKGDVVMDDIFITTPANAALSRDMFVDYKLPGMRNNKYTNLGMTEMEKKATQVWLKYGYDVLPPLYHNTEEDEVYSSNQSSINDYVNTMVIKFILGEEELNEDTWEAYKNQIIAFGVEDNIAIQQAAYDRYLAR